MVRPLVVAVVLLVAPAGLAQPILRYGFDPKDKRSTSFVAGDRNVTVKELAHNIIALAGNRNAIEEQVKG